MKIVVLTDDLYAYLLHVLETHCRRGFDTEELPGIYHLNQEVRGAKHIDDKDMARLNVVPSGSPVSSGPAPSRPEGWDSSVKPGLDPEDFSKDQ